MSQLPSCGILPTSNMVYTERLVTFGVQSRSIRSHLTNSRLHGVLKMDGDGLCVVRGVVIICRAGMDRRRELRRNRMAERILRNSGPADKLTRMHLSASVAGMTHAVNDPTLHLLATNTPSTSLCVVDQAETALPARRIPVHRTLR